VTNKNKNQTSAANPSTLLWVAIVACLAAMGVHAYLLSEHYNLRYGQAAAGGLCDINALFNCAAVSASQYSEVLGFPVALLGLVANFVLVLFVLWYLMAEDETKPTARVVTLTLGSLIAVTSLVMGGISSIILQKYCPFCMGAYVLSFITAGCLWVALKSTSKTSKSMLRPAPIGKGLMTPIVIILAAALGVKIANDQIRSSYKSDDMTRFANEQVRVWASAAPDARLQSVEPLVEGASKETAKMTIVEFADFRCSHCKHAAPVLHAFTSAHPDVRLEFMAWPLDGECNTSIPNANGASCLLARAVYCAQKEGGNGWAAHSWVFEHQEEMASLDIVKSLLPKIADASGVASEKLIACSQSAEAKSIIEKQAAMGTTLQLGGTPTVFVNGKKLDGGQMMPVLTEAYSVLKSK
jgi:protein-disulfide isomerase/uncharacterized membrane protein